MKQSLEKIGLGGGCHWCTEAVFQSIRGVQLVEQGWISSTTPNDTFSEAVIVHYRKEQIDLLTLLQIHLHTHSSTSQHTMRKKYRSAIYSFSNRQTQDILELFPVLQRAFDQPLITQVLPFQGFKKNIEKYQNYYSSNPQLAFCQTYIEPKLSFLQRHFSSSISKAKKE